MSINADHLHIPKFSCEIQEETREKHQQKESEQPVRTPLKLSGKGIASRLSKWFFWSYWLTLIVMVFIAVIGSQAVTRSDDLRVYLMASRVAPYNTNWVSVVRDREKSDTTALLVNVPGTNDKAHMRYIEHMTADLAGMGREDLMRLIQSDTEASVANEPVYGKLVDVDPKMAKLLYYDTKSDMLLLGLTLFSLPEVIFLITTTAVSLLRYVLKAVRRWVFSPTRQRYRISSRSSVCARPCGLCHSLCTVRLFIS
ncbi:hypothetical protein AB6G95_19420 [Proteus vulgaris]|uniref:hypothetical protein n=1 Tax=Proteus vulgaris TaxID=585 RepID=UPI0034DD2996